MSTKNIMKGRKLKKSYSLYNTFYSACNNTIRIQKCNSTEKLKSIKKIKKVKKNLSYRQSLYNRFYKLLKNRTIKKPKYDLFPQINDKNTFNFSLKDENNDILIRTLNIDKGNKKHILYSNIASKREREKIREAKEFRNKMKIIESNLKIIQKNNLEEKRKMKELIMIRKIKKINPKGKNNDIKSYILKNDNKLINKKLEIRKGKLINKFEEIMKRIHKNNN